MLKRYALAILLLIAATLLWSCEWRRELASEHITIAHYLNDPTIELTPEVRAQFKIPDHLDSRDDIVEHYLKRAAWLDSKQSGAHYYLGVFYLDGRDCTKAAEHLHKHLNIIPQAGGAQTLLAIMESEGCLGARLHLSDFDKDARERYYKKHPEVRIQYGWATSN